MRRKLLTFEKAMQNAKLLFWNILVTYHNATLEFTKCSLQAHNLRGFILPILQSRIQIRWTIYSLIETALLEMGIGMKRVPLPLLYGPELELTLVTWIPS